MLPFEGAWEDQDRRNNSGTCRRRKVLGQGARLDTPATGDSGHWNYEWIANDTVVTNRALSASFESALGGVGIAKHGSYSLHAFKVFSLVRQ